MKKKKQTPSEKFLSECDETFNKCYEILEKKNEDYSGDDQDPFKNFKNSITVGVAPERGVLVRIMDKIQRVSNLIDKEPNVLEESIDDTLIDLINYSVILKIFLKQKNGN